MSALENAKNGSSQDVLNKIREANLSEYGIYAQPLFDRLMAAKEESAEEQKELGVVAALNNADTEHVLLTVLKEQPEKVMEGISIAAYALGTEKKSLQIPEEETDLFESLKETAEKYGGYADFSARNGIFRANVFIPLEDMDLRLSDKAG